MAGKIAGGGPQDGNLSWYHDPLPTNCVADWVCPAGSEAGFPAFSYTPGPEYGYNNLAVFYQEREDHENAIAHYKTVIRLHPGIKEAHYNLGLIYVGEGLLDNAAVEFKAVLAIDPSYGEARGQLDRVMRLRAAEK